MGVSNSLKMHPKNFMLLAFLVLLHQTRISTGRKLSTTDNKIEIIGEVHDDQDQSVEDHEILDKAVPTKDLSVNVTTNDTTDLNDKDVPTISETTEENDNEPFIVLYIKLIRDRRFAHDYEGDLY